MALSSLEREAVTELKTQGYSTTEIMGFIASERAGKDSRLSREFTSQSAVDEKSGPGVFRRVLSDIPSDVVDTVKNVKGSFQRGFEKAGEASIQRGKGEISRGAEIAKGGGSLLSGVAGAIGEVGLGIGKLFTTQEAEDRVGKFIAEKAEQVMETEPAQKLMEEWEQLSPEQRAWIEGAVGTFEGLATPYGVGAGLRMTRNMVGAVKRGATVATLKGIKSVSEATEALSGISVPGIAGINMANKMGFDPNNIMQRVARITKKQQADFEQRAGQSVGAYLVSRNIFGTPDELVDQLWKRFQSSKDRVDKGLAGIKTKYKHAGAREALMELAERETKIGIVGHTSPQQARIMELLKKHHNEGLNLSELNEVKRLYERNVKLDFVREINSTGIARANNVDRALADFIVKKADENGFANVKALNKETMLARQLVDDLGAWHSGTAGNNALSLSDTIFLAEATTGNVGSIATAIGKKVLGSDRVMSSVARLMAKNRGELADLPSIGAKSDPNKLTGYLEFLGRQQDNPNFNRGEIPATTPKKAPVATVGLLDEAKKYGSADEFVKAQGEPVFHGGGKVFSTSDDIEFGDGSFGQNGFWTLRQSQKNLEDIDSDTGGFFSPDELRASPAEAFGGEVTTFYFTPSKTTKIKEVDAKGKDYNEFETDTVVETARKDGFDAVIIKNVEEGFSGSGTLGESAGLVDDVVVFDKNLLKTRSQLEEIWKQANGKTSLKVDNFTPEQVDTVQKAVLGRQVFENGKWVDAPDQKAVILDSDMVKKSHPDYNPDRPQDLHADSSAINTDTYKKALAQDESGVVKMTSGGAGSGKSELVVDNLKGEPGVILDGTLSKFDKDTEMIDLALDAGKKVEIHAVYPDVSLAYVFNRLRTRSVPDKAFAQTHAGQRANIPELFAKYSENENVSWNLYQNSRFGTPGGQMDIDSIKGAIQHQASIDVENAMEIGKKLLEIVEEGNMPNMEDYINGYKRLTQK